MRFSFSRIVPPVLALLMIPGLIGAQEPVADPSAGIEADSAATARIQGWLAEMQEISGRLQVLQEQALADPTLAADQVALGERIRTAMTEVDPALEASMARVEELQIEAAAAQQEGNTARLQELGTEVREIETRFMAAQQQALAAPELKADVEAFQTRLEAKIIELDAEATVLIARFQELQEQLGAAMRTGG